MAFSNNKNTERMAGGWDPRSTKSLKKQKMAGRFSTLQQSNIAGSWPFKSNVGAGYLLQVIAVSSRVAGCHGAYPNSK